MREIKFRAWNKETGSMLPWEWFDRMNDPYTALLCSHYDSATYAIMQYAGLKDKNGVESYHKDLVKDSWNNIWCIDWSDEYAGFELTLIKAGILGEILKLNICRVIDMEIIGNIYENPELLEVKC